MCVSAPIVLRVKWSISAIRPAGIQVSTGALKSLKAQADWGHVDGKISALFCNSQESLWSFSSSPFTLQQRLMVRSSG